MSSPTPEFSLGRFAAPAPLRERLLEEATECFNSAPRGTDGLTDHERADSAARYRSKVGAKPAVDDAHRAKRDAMAARLRVAQAAPESS